jgi:L-amino acid N-acyltransferase YncA
MSNDPSTAPALPASLELRDGRKVTLRGIREQDKAAIRTAFHRLSPDSRYTRFMMSVRDVPEALLEAATHPVQGREFTVIAVHGEGAAETIVAAARYVGVADSDTCEFAVTVADDWHALGLARRLLVVLIAAATTQGFHCMEGFVLTRNTAMRRLARALGFVDHPSEDDATLREVRLDLGAGGCAGQRPGPQ